MTKHSAFRHSSISPQEMLYVYSIKELYAPMTTSLTRLYHGRSVRTPQLGCCKMNSKPVLEMLARNRFVSCPSYRASPSNSLLTIRRDFARNHQPSPRMVNMAPKTRASGEGGIVISCADPRVPCDKILGFDETISINLEALLEGFDLTQTYRSGRDPKRWWARVGRHQDHRGHANYHRANLDHRYAPYR